MLDLSFAGLTMTTRHLATLKPGPLNQYFNGKLTLSSFWDFKRMIKTHISLLLDEMPLETKGGMPIQVIGVAMPAYAHDI
jgi:hypothetical protein